MEFKTLFQILKKHLSNGYDVPTFFRELIEMITTVPEDEWTTAGDLSQDRKDETLRNYAKQKKLPKKMAQSIVYHLNPQNMTDSLSDREEDQRRLLAEDLKGYDPDINSSNVAEKVTTWVVSIIQESAGCIPQDDLKKKKSKELSRDLKDRYGDYLVREVDGYCPNCGRQITFPNAGKSMNVFEVSLIDKDGGTDLDNLIAMCPQCCATYSMDDRKAIMKELKIKKAALKDHSQTASLMDGFSLEKGITDVVKRVSKLKEKDTAKAKLDPKELNKKIDPDKELSLYIMVNQFATTYFITIKKIMINLDKRKVIDYDEVQDQMIALYKKLSKTKKSQMAIFTAMSEKIHHVTLQEEIYCQIVVAFFIQKCEVF